MLSVPCSWTLCHLQLTCSSQNPLVEVSAGCQSLLGCVWARPGSPWPVKGRIWCVNTPASLPSAERTLRFSQEWPQQDWFPLLTAAVHLLTHCILSSVLPSHFTLMGPPGIVTLMKDKSWGRSYFCCGSRGNQTVSRQKLSDKQPSQAQCLLFGHIVKFKTMVVPRAIKSSYAGSHFCHSHSHTHMPSTNFILPLINFKILKNMTYFIPSSSFFALYFCGFYYMLRVSNL